jgi:hypothetical protein
LLVGNDELFGHRSGLGWVTDVEDWVSVVSAGWISSSGASLFAARSSLKNVGLEMGGDDCFQLVAVISNRRDVA